MADALYDIGIRLAVATSAFTLGINEALGAFRKIEQAATSADTTVGRFGPRLDKAFGSMQQSAQRASAAYDALAASQRRLDMGGATMAQHGAKIDAVNKAQADFNARQAAYNDLLAQQARATDEAAAAQDRLSQAQRGMNMIAAGGAITLFGASMRGFLGEAIGQAETFNTVMTQVGQTLTTTAGAHLAPTQQVKALADLQAATLSIGDQTGQGQIAVGEIMRAAERAGMTQPQVLLGPDWMKGGTQGGILPGLATFSQLMNLSRGYTPDQAATVATEFAHLLGSWQPAAFNQMTGLLGRALMVSPATPQEFLTTARQLSTTIRPLYGTDTSRLISDVLTTTALEQEMGVGERGGTELARLITRTLGGNGKLTSAQNTALAKIRRLSGIDFFNPATGAFAGVSKTIEALAAVAAKESPYQAEKDFQAAFMQVGGRQAGILSTQTTLHRLATLHGMLGPNGLPSTQAAMDQLLKTPAGQQYVAGQEWSNFEVLLGTKLLPEVSTLATAVGNVLRTITDIGNRFPLLADIGTQFLAWSTVLATLTGPLLVIGGSIKLITGAVGGLREVAAAFREVAAAEEASAVAGGAAGAGGASSALARVGAIAGAASVYAAPAALYLYAETPTGRKQARSAVHSTDTFIEHTPFGYLADALGAHNLVQGAVNDIKGLGYDIFGGRPKATPTQVHNHLAAGAIVVQVQTHPGQNAHEIAKAAANEVKKQFGALGNGLDIMANYGPTVPFTTNPTLRSAGQ